ARHAFSMTLRNRGGSDQRRAVRPDDPRILREEALQLADLEGPFVECAEIPVQHLLDFENLHPVHRSSQSRRPISFSLWSRRRPRNIVLTRKARFIQALSVRARRIQAITAESTSPTRARPTRRRIVS